MIIVYTIAAILLVLAAVLLLNAVRASRKARVLEGEHPTFTEDELIQLLQEASHE